MSTSSIVIESKDIPEHKHTQNRRVVVTPSLPIKEKKYEAIRMRLYRHFTETIRSIITVFAWLALYKITGVHDWWIQFIHSTLFTP